MAGSEPRDQTSDEATQQVGDLLASPELARGAAGDEYKRFLDYTPVAIAVSKLTGGEHRITYVNQAFEALIGQTLGEVEGKTRSVLDALWNEDLPDLRLGQALAEGEDFLGIFRLKREGAEPIAVQAYVSRIETEEGVENYSLAALVDVTERERAQREEFERLIRDKDLLLKEVQHRVKNNLQLIIGLIRLESRSARRGEPVDLDRLAGRIDSLRLLYDAMSAHRPGDDDLDLGHYLSQIASAAVHTHASDQVRLDLKVEFCPASINVAMPAGLAVNELLTNAFKYAFQGKESGIISLECLREGDDRCLLVVADDGVGMPPGITWPVPGKLGALITQTLRENAKLDLKVETAPGHGTRVSMIFLHKATTGVVN